MPAAEAGGEDADVSVAEIHEVLGGARAAGAGARCGGLFR
jgi:hypothetical protein